MRALPPLLWLCLLVAPAVEARGWRKDIGHRPRATLDARDAAHLQRLRDRIHAREAPWSLGYEQLRALAERGRVVPHGASGWRGQPDRWAALYGQEVQNGLVARAKAAVAWLGAQGVDPGWLPLPRLPGQTTPDGWLRQQAAEAAGVIDGMYDDWPGWRGFSVLNRGIVSAESLLVHAQAWDLLAGLPASLRPGLGRGERRIAALAEDHAFYAWILDGPGGNHPIRVDAGLATAGVVLNRWDRYRWWQPWTWWADPKDWVRRGERELDPERRGGNLREQLESGAFAEGTSYHHYAADLHGPFHWAYARAGGDAFHPFASARLERLWRWDFAIRLPDGRRPAVDNSPLTRSSLGALTVNRLPRGSFDQEQRRRQGWDWSDQGWPGAQGARSLELLSAFDPSPADQTAIAASAAPGGAAFLPDEGAAVLRSGPGREAAHALLLCEHGSARTRGGGHEDVDPLALAVWAEGDALLLDPGYPGWSGVGATRSAEHHSLVLIDGAGPPGPRKTLFGLGPWEARGADAFLEPGERTFDGRALDSAAARTEYRGARLRRTATLLRGRALVVEDLVEAGGPRDLTAAWQAGGGGTKRGRAALTGLGLSFTTHRLAVPVELAVATTRGPAALALATNRDALGGDLSPAGHDQHATLLATVRADRARLLTLIAWGAPGAAPPPVPVRILDRPGATALAAGTGAGWTVVAAAQEATQLLLLPATATTPAIETDGTTLVVAIEQGVVVAAVAHDATLLRVATPTPLALSRSGPGTLRHDP